MTPNKEMQNVFERTVSLGGAVFGTITSAKLSLHPQKQL